jgi:hypothetical protein
MIFVLGISLILVDSLYLFNLVKIEGFLGDEYDTSNNSNKPEREKRSFYETDPSDNLMKNKSENFSNTNSDNTAEESDEESDYMHDKSIIKKLKQLNPIILNTIENMNSVHIKEINKTINNLTDKMDP